LKFGLQHPNFTFDGAEIVEKMRKVVGHAEGYGFNSSLRGKDYDSILKTKLGQVMIDKSK